MKTTVVRYKTFPERADENAALIAQVFAALERQQPAGLRYEAMRGRDGVTFTHVASVDEAPAQHPLTSLPEFQAFLAGIRERCVEPPVQVESVVLGRWESAPAPSAARERGLG
ncbi:hypothetical protein [Piscinibacter sp. XHJ-5]|uniref:hypothetical protein n=1 Tax=Piscinibacter sp. XHJ-5 TaxID=3037797 RepID=UPI0024531EE6|nr:hypothetical protein [Piscinibacter sp. XHJ-5]